MSATYFAYLCYPRLRFGDSTEYNEPLIKFDLPVVAEYETVLPIQFSVLHGWSDRDKELYK